jgi:hypothetical protein
VLIIQGILYLIYLVLNGKERNRINAGGIHKMYTRGEKI